MHGSGPDLVDPLAMDGSDDEVDKNHYCSKDLFAEAPEGFRMGKTASTQRTLRYRLKKLDEGCSLAAASPALGMREPWSPRRAYGVQRSL